MKAYEKIIQMKRDGYHVHNSHRFLRESPDFLKFKKATNPLQQTKDLYKHRNKFEEEELKEFSILFLIINNLDIFRKNIELISEITFSNNLMNEFKQKLIDYL